MLRRVVALSFAIGIFGFGTRAFCQNVAHPLNRAQTLEPVLEILDRAKLSGFLAFTGTCNSLSIRDFPEFPPLQAAPTNVSPIEQLRQMLASDSTMQVTEGPAGVVRMIETDVPTDVLKIRIDHISFDNGQPGGPRPTNSPNIALLYITGTPEIKSFMQSNDAVWPYGGIIGDSIPKVPTTLSPEERSHILGPLDNVTFAEAMDYVLGHFPGIWIYENCPRTKSRQRMIYFRFYQLERTGSSVTVQ